MRRAQPDNRGDSFGTISAFGANAAVIHYRPTEDSDAPITNDNVFLRMTKIWTFQLFGYDLISLSIN